MNSTLILFKKMDSTLSDHLLLFQAFLQTGMTENQTQMHI